MAGLERPLKVLNGVLLALALAGGVLLLLRVLGIPAIGIEMKQSDSIALPVFLSDAEHAEILSSMQRATSKRQLFMLHRSKRPRDRPPRARTQDMLREISLKGVMSSGSESVAFFTYKGREQVCRPGDTIGGFVVIRIDVSEVVLQTGDEHVSLRP